MGNQVETGFFMDNMNLREEEVKESDFRQESLAKQTYEDFTKN